MKEMENIPRDNNRNNNILVDDDENDKNKNQENNSNIIVNPQDISLNVRAQEKNLEYDNYLSEMFQQNFSVNIIILCFIIIIMMLEYIYNQALFTYSLTYEQNLQNSLSEISFQFFKILSFLGNGPLIGLGLFFILCFFPLVKTIMICLGIIFMVYIQDILKLFYADPRPFWINTILFQGKCETSYGNPSGHSLTSFYFILSFCYYINMMEKIKNNITMKIIVYLLGFLISSLTAFSRLALGVHSINQVVYGSLLGIWGFLMFAYVFKIYDMPLNYYLKFFKEKKFINFCLVASLILLIIPIILYLLIDVQSDIKKYDLVMSKKCPKKKEYKLYSHSCLAEALIILVGIGIYFGQYFFWYMIYRKKNESLSTNDNNYDNSLEESVNNWNKYIKEIFYSMSNFIKVFGIFILTLLPGIFYIMISGKNNNLRTIFIFKFGLPFFLIGFLSFGPCFYAFINVLKEKKNYFKYPEESQFS